ncbi:MAG: type II secretion system F family protein [Actinomycetota bacterium]
MDPVLLVSCGLIGLSVSMLVYLVSSRDAVIDGHGMAHGATTLAPRVPTALDTSPPPSDDPDSLSNQTSNLHEVLLQRSRSERVVKPWLDKVNSVLSGTTPKKRIDTLHVNAVTAGLARTWTPQRIATARTISLAAGITLGLLSWQAMGGMTGVAFGIILAGVGWRGFDTYITNRARSRQEQIQMDLPDIADQIAISVQAGLSFEQAIRRTVDSTTGPLSEELARFLHDTRVGMVRQRAFKNMQERVDVSDVTSFIRAIAQAEKTGVSIAEILQIQADELREKRKQRAEERAMKLPVLMLMPLVTCILPPLLIVLLGPAIIQVMQGGFGG